MIQAKQFLIFPYRQIQIMHDKINMVDAFEHDSISLLPIR